MLDLPPAYNPNNASAVLEYFTRQILAPFDSIERAFGARPDHTTAVTYFLLDLVSGHEPAPAGEQDLSTLAGVDPFIHYTLARLLYQLSHSTEQHPVEYHAQVRGRILWNATYKARFSEEYNPSIYVCSQVRQRYDNPENQLLKYLLEHIEAGLKTIPAFIHKGTCYLPQGENRLPQSIARRLEALETTIHRLKRSARLREISAPHEISERHLLRAQTSRTEEYNDAAELFFMYKRTVLQPSWQSLASTARRILPLPAVLDQVSQPWIDLAANLWKYPHLPGDRAWILKSLSPESMLIAGCRSSRHFPKKSSSRQLKLSKKSSDLLRA